MIIYNIKAKMLSLQDKRSIMIILKTSNGKFKSKMPLDSDSFYDLRDLNKDIYFVNNVLKNKIKDLEVNNFDDIYKFEDIIEKEGLAINKLERDINFLSKTLKNGIKDIDISTIENIKHGESIYNKREMKIDRKTMVAVEIAILFALSKNEFWKYINPDIKQIPRPLGIIFGSSELKQSCDFKQILLFSLECNNFSKAINANLRVHELLEKEIKKYDKNFEGEINIEGALVANVSNFDVLDLISRICKQVSNEFKFDIRIGINFDADKLYKEGGYYYKNFSNNEKEKKLSKKEQIDFIVALENRYNLFYIEDPLENTDFKGYAKIKKKTSCLVIGNKLINQNIENLNEAIKNKSINAFVFKISNSNSLLELKYIIDLAYKNNIRVISETSNYETEQNFIVYFSIAFGVPVIKYGIYKKDNEKIKEIIKIEKIMKSK